PAVAALAARLAGLVARVRRAAHRGVADRVGALAPRPGRVPQHVGPRAVGGDAGTEAENVCIDGDGLARRRQRQALDDGVGEPFSLRHWKSPNPSHARHADGMSYPGMYRTCPDIATRSADMPGVCFLSSSESR